MKHPYYGALTHGNGDVFLSVILLIGKLSLNL